MAIGGALRAAIKAADWVNVARESRRRARALADLNARGGIRGSAPMRFGVEGGDPATVGRMVDRGFYPDMYAWDAPGPRGNTVFLNPRTGAREILAPDFRRAPSGQRLIQAPYEGFRVLPPNSRIGVSEDLRVPPGQWQGRGAGTSWAEMPFNGYDAIDGTYYSPIREPAFPDWRFSAFGDVGFAPNISRFSSPGMTPVPFEEVMRAQGSLMGDPRLGPYVPF